MLKARTSDLPWTRPSSLSKHIPQSPSKKEMFYKIDLFHVGHKGVMGDVCANAIATCHIEDVLHMCNLFCGIERGEKGDLFCFIICKMKSGTLKPGFFVWPEHRRYVHIFWPGFCVWRACAVCKRELFTFAHAAAFSDDFGIPQLMVLPSSVPWHAKVLSEFSCESAIPATFAAFYLACFGSSLFCPCLSPDSDSGDGSRARTQRPWHTFWSTALPRSFQMIQGMSMQPTSNRFWHACGPRARFSRSFTEPRYGSPMVSGMLWLTPCEICWQTSRKRPGTVSTFWSWLASNSNRSTTCCLKSGTNWFATDSLVWSHWMHWHSVARWTRTL